MRVLLLLFLFIPILTHAVDPLAAIKAMWNFANKPATEATQWANRVQLMGVNLSSALQARRQFEQLRYQFKNGISLSQFEWGEGFGALEDLVDVVRDGQSMDYTLSNLDEVFRQKFQEYVSNNHDPMKLALKLKGLLFNG